MNKETYNLLHKIYADRMHFWRDKNSVAASAYESAMVLLEYAYCENIEDLRQFDYYGES